MPTKLPARPNLDHLRRQAKVLLADLAAGKPVAAAVFSTHLPAARKLTTAQVLATPYRLADAQAAVARQNGFAGWPHLARHVEQLRALEGEWAFERLELDGHVMPGAALTASRILIDGDRFRTESPEANYEGVFNINVEAAPHEIDVEFVAGPEAGRTNSGIFRLDGHQLELCLDLNGGPRPKAFQAPPRSGHACELLRRVSAARPNGVDGGQPPSAVPTPTAAGATPPSGFDYAPSALLTKLEGEWVAEEIVRDGIRLPAMMLRTGRRVATGNEVRISVAGQLMLHALVKYDESAQPLAVDYYHVGGRTRGAIQFGIMRWDGESARFCMAAPGQPRPAEFTSEPGSGRTLSCWRPKR